MLWMQHLYKLLVLLKLSMEDVFESFTKNYPPSPLLLQLPKLSLYFVHYKFLNHQKSNMLSEKLWSKLNWNVFQKISINLK